MKKRVAEVVMAGTTMASAIAAPPEANAVKNVDWSSKNVLNSLWEA